MILNETDYRSCLLHFWRLVLWMDVMTSAAWGGDQWSGSQGKELQGLPQSGRWEQTHLMDWSRLQCSTLALRPVYLEYVDCDSALRFCCARHSEVKDFQLMDGSIDREYQVLCHGFWSRVACVSSCSPMILPFLANVLPTTPKRVCHLTWPLVRPWTSNWIKNGKTQFKTTTFHSWLHLLFSREVDVNKQGSKRSLRSTLHVCSIVVSFAHTFSFLVYHTPSPFQRRIVKFESTWNLRKLHAKHPISRHNSNRVSSIGRNSSVR